MNTAKDPLENLKEKAKKYYASRTSNPTNPTDVMYAVLSAALQYGMSEERKNPGGKTSEY